MGVPLSRFRKIQGDGSTPESRLDLATWNGLVDEVGSLLAGLIKKGADFDAVAATAIGVLLDRVNAVLVPAYDHVVDLAGQADERIALLNGNGVSAAAVLETSQRRFLSAAQIAEFAARPTSSEVAAAIDAALGDGEYQPLSDKLTTIAATNTANTGFYQVDSLTFGTYTINAQGRSLLGAADSAALRTIVGTRIGTDVQAYSAKLQAYAGQTWAVGQVPYFTGTASLGSFTITAGGRSLVALAVGAANKVPVSTGADTYALADITNDAKTLLAASSQAAMRAAIGAIGNINRIMPYTTSGAKAFHAETTAYIAILVGGGASAGSARATAASRTSAGAGGGGGSWLVSPVVTKTSASLTVGIGAGGATTSGASAQAGNDGGATTAGDGAVSYSAPGGKAGGSTEAAATPGAGANPAANAAPTTGLVNVSGALGLYGQALPDLAFGGHGGASPFGTGGLGGKARGTASDSQAGAAGAGYGSGGGGGASVDGTGAAAGGAGADGVVLVVEFK